VRYFIPEWDDRVDPKYDFMNDVHSREHEEDPIKNDVYIWNIFGLNKVPIDGVLVSRFTIMQNKKKYRRVLQEGIHSVLRLPSTFEIMGDCGAWGYIQEEAPPFKTSEVLDYYVKCGFNYGVSVDHLVVPEFKEQNERRWRITLENAQEMFALWQSRDEYMQSVRLVGVAQGWDVQSYVRSTSELLKIGYDYIGLGGLARSQTGTNQEFGQSKTIYNVVNGVSSEIRKWMKENKRRVDIHLFGIARPELMPELAKYGVSSFDSASFLRKAWLSADKNYYSLDGEFYGAIRIPQTEKSPLVKELPEVDKLTILESRALETVRSYDGGKAPLDDALKAIVDYDKAIGEKRDFERHYRRTLLEMPWKKCPCPICKSVGVEVIIFRGNNRNRRRGFHNTFSFYNRLRKSVPRILVFTNCTREKDQSSRLMPAFQRYLPSPAFKTFWNHVCDLPVEIGVLSGKFGLIDWSNRIPYYDYTMQEDDIPKFVGELEEKLKRYDKTFFIGLGLYKEVVSRVRDETVLSIEIFGRTELIEREKLDVPEYTKLMKNFREAIVKAIPEKHRPANDESVSE